MALVGTVQICNYTPFRRAQIASTILPLAPGIISDSIQPPLVARDANGPGIDVGVQYSKPTKWGVPKHPDGSWKIARVHFPASLAGNGPSRYSYSNWTQKDIAIETGPGQIPTFQPSPYVDVSKIRLTMTVQARASYHSGTPPVRQVTWTPTTGYYRSYQAPYSVTEPSRRELEDTAGGSNRWIRAYVTEGRIVPEGIDNNAARATEEPSFVGRFIYEIPDQSAYTSRFVRWWFEICNSDTTLDADARAPDMVAMRILSPARLRITTTDTTNFPITVIPGLRAGWQPVLQELPNGADLTLYEPARWSSGDKWNMGVARVYRGYIVFRGGPALAPIEADTLNAAAWSEGEQQWSGAVSLDWPDRNSWGIFGNVPKAEEFGWNTREDIRNIQIPGSKRFRDYYIGQNAWPAYPRHNGGAAPGSAGGQPNLGHSNLVDYAMAGNPEEGGVWLSATCDALRGLWLRANDGQTFYIDDAAYRSEQVEASFETPYVALDSVPKWSSNWGNYNLTTNRPPPDWAEHGGKQKPYEKGPGGYSGYKNSHMVLNTVVFASFLYADRWVIDSCLHDLRNVALMSKDGTDPDDFFGFFASDVGTGSPRELGRPLRTKAHFYSLTGDPKFINQLARRANLMYQWGFTNVYPEADSRSNLLNTIPCIVPDSGYPNRLVVDCSQAGTNLDPIWHPPGQQGLKDWSPWQNGLMCAGLYGAWLALRMHDEATYASQIDNARAVLAVMSKGLLKHGFRERPDGTLDTYYNTNYEWDGNKGTAISLADQLDEYRYCNAINSSDPTDTVVDRLSGQTRRRIIGAGTPTELFGRSTGANQFPIWKEGGESWIRWSFGGWALAGIFNPGDSEVAALLQDRLVDRRVIPSESFIRGTLMDYSDSWFQWGCILADFSRRWVGGPRTYNEQARPFLSLRTTAAEVVTYNEVANPVIDLVSSATEEYNGTTVGGIVFFEEAHPTISLIAEAEDTSNVLPPVGVGATYYEEAKPVISLVSSAVEGITFYESANPRLSMVTTVSESLGWNEVAAPTISLVTTARETGTVGTGEEEEPAPQPDDGAKTLRELLGPTLTRARGLRITRNPDGTLSRSTSALPYKSPPPREIYKRDQRRRR